jgi:hypothetical protein
MDTNNSETKQGAVVPADLLQQKPHVEVMPTWFHLWLLGSIKDGLLAKVGKSLKLQAYNSNFLGLEG